VVGARQQHLPAAGHAGGDRAAGLRHHRVLKAAEQHDRRDADLAEPSEPRRVRLFQITDLEPRRDRAAHHGDDAVVRVGRRPGPQAQAQQPVAVSRRDQRAALGGELVIGGPRIVVDSRCDERQGPGPFRELDSQPEYGPAASAVPAYDGALEAEMVEHRMQVPEPGERFRRTRGSPEPPQVIPDHPVAVSQQRNQRRPDARVRPVRVDKHDRRPAAPGVLAPQRPAGYGNAHFHGSDPTSRLAALPHSDLSLISAAITTQIGDGYQTQHGPRCACGPSRRSLAAM
jgi:hypothetical protein